ncbi:MAG TPA: T9SS type A sorting domain-containing protein, partial [Bacteroidia bacterium]|nr:T9SS type A sorting domain-containing protein [Bacteroidia bacterium]
TGSTSDTTIVAPTVPTSYTVTATNAKGCSDTASFTVTIKTVTAVNTVTDINGIVIYPNPATELLNIELNTGGTVMAVLIRITDVSGKEIMEAKRALVGNTTLPVNISNLAAGMYFVRIEAGTSIQVVKFIKK